jgi:hypothetical protein
MGIGLPAAMSRETRHSQEVCLTDLTCTHYMEENTEVLRGAVNAPSFMAGKKPSRHWELGLCDE